ncbi:MAG: hypothetical protein COZ06_03585 [Armatimonadetes bacterium CG_4_10_14_3_um_filter_66_18]|nr:MAG: hypothetical protein COZ06_03585 [Armatimonadetes bacterium CG_4_10_14_3_um_filter_66_18]
MPDGPDYTTARANAKFGWSVASGSLNRAGGLSSEAGKRCVEMARPDLTRVVSMGAITWLLGA